MESGIESQPNSESLVNWIVAVVCVMVAFYIYRKTRRICRTEDLPNNCVGMRLYGVVTKISDGDGFSFFHCPWLRSKIYASEDDWLDVRLAGIDAPEMGNSDMPRQDFALESMGYLKSLILRKEVEIKVVGKDQYNRILAFAYLPGWFAKLFLNQWFSIDFCGLHQMDCLYTNVNLEMVEKGYAFVYTGLDAKYDKYKKTLKKLEKEAKRGKKGVWKFPNPVTPMEHKRIYRK